MNVETYATIMLRLYMGLLFLFIFINIIAIWNKIRKKRLKYWWIIPCSILYPISAIFNTFIAYIAYDDPADPNYRIYENWKLHDFILSDIKMLIIWLFIGALLYLGFERKNYKMPIKIGCISVLIFLTILLVFTLTHA